MGILSLALLKDQAQKSSNAIGAYLAITLIYEVARKCREAFQNLVFSGPVAVVHRLIRRNNVRFKRVRKLGVGEEQIRSDT